MVRVKSRQGVSLFGSYGLVDGRGCGGLSDGATGGWAWGCGGAGEVAPVVGGGAEGEEGVALGGVDGVLGVAAGWGLGGAGWTGGVVGKEPVCRQGP